MRKAQPKPNRVWLIGAANKIKMHADDNEVGAVVFPICRIKAPSEAAAVKKAKAQLAKGNGYDAETAFVREVTE